MNSRDKAIEKANQENKININRIKDLCKKLNYGELAYCLYYIHTIRIVKITREIDTIANMNIDRFNDVLKYSISCIFKYSDISKIPSFNYEINVKNSVYMTKLSNHLHSLHEAISFLTIFDEVSLVGKNNCYAEIDLSSVMSDPVKQKSLEYSTRFQTSSTRDKNNLLSHTDLLDAFETKYKRYNFISLDIFGLTIEEIKACLHKLFEMYITNIKKNEINMPVLKNGDIDLESIETLKEVVKCFIVNEETILQIFGKNGMRFIRQHTFKKSDFKPHELNYHYLNRRPLLKIKHDYIIVPELLLDSLMINFHYTLLENEKFAEIHKDAMSKIYVDELSNMAQRYGYLHHDSELELYKGKNKLGDIDLVLRHPNIDHDILVEAKNHVVPLAVYFGDHNAISKRLTELQKGWEKKVDQRFQHLLTNYGTYNLNEDFKYIIVSRYPEILSHHSDILVLSKEEFEFYLKHNAKYETFYDLFHDMYPDEDYDIEDIESFMKETLNIRAF